MKKKYKIIWVSLLLIYSHLPAQPVSGELIGLAAMKPQYTTQRVSSAAPTGGNDDALQNQADGTLLWGDEEK